MNYFDTKNNPPMSDSRQDFQEKDFRLPNVRPNDDWSSVLIGIPCQSFRDVPGYLEKH